MYEQAWGFKKSPTDHPIKTFLIDNISMVCSCTFTPKKVFSGNMGGDSPSPHGLPTKNLSNSCPCLCGFTTSPALWDYFSKRTVLQNIFIDTFLFSTKKFVFSLTAMRFYIGKKIMITLTCIQQFEPQVFANRCIPFR